MAPADDLSIAGNIGILRGLKPTEIELDSHGLEIPARAAFKSHCLSAFRTRTGLAQQMSSLNILRPLALLVSRLKMCGTQAA
jgi:hypothetical protein